MKKNIINDASTSPTTNEGDGGIERWKENLQNTFIDRDSGFYGAWELDEAGEYKDESSLLTTLTCPENCITCTGRQRFRGIIGEKVVTESKFNFSLSMKSAQSVHPGDKIIVLSGSQQSLPILIDLTIPRSSSPAGYDVEVYIEEAGGQIADTFSVPIRTCAYGSNTESVTKELILNEWTPVYFDKTPPFLNHPHFTILGGGRYRTIDFCNYRVEIEGKCSGYVAPSSGAAGANVRISLKFGNEPYSLIYTLGAATSTANPSSFSASGTLCAAPGPYYGNKAMMEVRALASTTGTELTLDYALIQVFCPSGFQLLKTYLTVPSGNQFRSEVHTFESNFNGPCAFVKV